MSQLDHNEAPDHDEVSECLRRIDEGDRSAVEQLLPHIYQDLKALADGIFRGQQADQTLQPTALVHEAFFRLVRPRKEGFNGRRHFLDVAAMAMRQILTDRARRRRATKRGGGQERVAIEDVDLPAGGMEGVDVIALDDALKELEKLAPRQVRIVEMRFLAGLTNQDVAEVLGVTERTVKRDWRIARAWLRQRLEEERPIES